jgi:phosphate transport system ATP-binding protein
MPAATKTQRVQTSPAPAGNAPAPKKLRVSHVNFFYEANQALYDVSLEIEANRITALIGPSGCGKSTFLRILNRMHETVRGTRVEGDVLLDGRCIFNVDVTLLRRRVGMVFQRANPFPKSIFDNVAYGLRINGLCPKRSLAGAVEDCLKRAALWDEVKDQLHKSAYALSGGQQQRLCIARALAINPEVLLLDEPSSALDPIATSKIEELLFELKKSCTIIIVTHNMQQAARIADRTGFFLHGRLIEIDETTTIFKNPSRKETEDYITGRFG